MSGKALWLKRILKAIVFGVRRDSRSGHLYYEVGNDRLHVRSALECERPLHRQYAFENIYFRHYLPTGTDCVVDFGAGLGTEILALGRKSPDLHYVAVEIQPTVYECLCLTLAQLPPGYVPYSLAVGSSPTVRIEPTAAGIDATTLGNGVVAVEGIAWPAFVMRHGIKRVDLLKMNIEGGEDALLRHIDLAIVDRIIVSVHDFRADRGDGEHFRTRSAVESLLSAAGFDLRRIDGAEDWMRSWIFAVRPAIDKDA